MDGAAEYKAREGSRAARWPLVEHAGCENGLGGAGGGSALRIVSLSCVFPNPAEPGLGLFVRNRLEALARLASVKVLAPVLPTSGVPRRRQEGGLEIFHPRWGYIPGSGWVTPLLLFVQLIGPLLRRRSRFPFQVLDAHFGYPEGVAAALLAAVFRIPFTVTLRGCELLHARFRCRRNLMNWALRRAGGVLAVSPQLAQFAANAAVDPARIRFIPNGVDAGAFFRRPQLDCRLKHKIPVDAPIILTAGRLIELKGHQHAIRAVKLLVQRGTAARLLIAGGSPGRGVPSYEPQLRLLLAELGLESSVQLLGPVPPVALAELMSAADVFVLASTREGWPNVVHEALGCGTPVVATRVGAVAELLPSERYGLIVPPADSAALALALESALRADWDRNAISAWAHSRSWAQVAEEVLTAMRQILGQAP